MSGGLSDLDDQSFLFIGRYEIADSVLIISVDIRMVIGVL